MRRFMLFVFSAVARDEVKLHKFHEIALQIDGEKVMLEMRDDESSAEVAARFCRKWNLLARDCNQLEAELRRLQNPQVDTKATEVKEEKEKIEEKETPAVEQQGSGIDYTQRLQPSLAIDWDQRRLSLQRYSGESAEAAVDRFCYTFGVEASMCATIRKRFTCLVKNYPDDLASCSFPESQDTTGSIPPLASSVYSPFFSERLRRISYTCFTLILAFLIVILQHNPDH